MHWIYRTSIGILERSWQPQIFQKSKLIQEVCNTREQFVYSSTDFIGWISIIALWFIFALFHNCSNNQYENSGVDCQCERDMKNKPMAKWNSTYNTTKRGTEVVVVYLIWMEDLQPVELLLNLKKLLWAKNMEYKHGKRIMSTSMCQHKVLHALYFL